MPKSSSLGEYSSSGIAGGSSGRHGQAPLCYPALPYIALHCVALRRLAYPSAVDDGKQYEKNVLGWDGGRGLEARLLLLLLLLVLPLLLLVLVMSQSVSQ